MHSSREPHHHTLPSIAKNMRYTTAALVQGPACPPPHPVTSARLLGVPGAPGRWGAGTPHWLLAVPTPHHGVWAVAPLTQVSIAAAGETASPHPVELPADLYHVRGLSRGWPALLLLDRLPHGRWVGVRSFGAVL